MDKAGVSQDIFSINTFLKNYDEVKNINTLQLGVKYNILNVKLKSAPSQKDWGIFLLATENTPTEKFQVPKPLLAYCNDVNIDLKNISEFGNVFLKVNRLDCIDADGAKKFLTRFTFGSEDSTPSWVAKYLDSIAKFNENFKSNKSRHKEALQNYAKLCNNISNADNNVNINVQNNDSFTMKEEKNLDDEEKIIESVYKKLESLEKNKDEILNNVEVKNEIVEGVDTVCDCISQSVKKMKYARKGKGKKKDEHLVDLKPPKIFDDLMEEGEIFDDGLDDVSFD